MHVLAELTRSQLLVFTLVFARIGGLVLSGPALGGSRVPARFRVLLAAALALLIAPVQAGAGPELPAAGGGVCLALGGELLVGYTLGFGVTLVLGGVQLAGHVVGQMSGMTLAEVYDGGSGAEVPLLSQLLFVLSSAFFFAIGGHRLLIGGLLDSFAAIPPGRAGFEGSLVETATALLEQSFSLGIRLAAPATAALLLASLVLGVISRALPQLHVMSLAMGVNTLAALAALALTLGSMGWVFHDEVVAAIEAVTSGAAAAAAVRVNLGGHG